MTAHLEAETLPCPACGVPLAVDPSAAEAKCRHCRTVSQVPPAVRDRARAHNRKLAQEASQISFAQRFARGDGIDKIASGFVGVTVVLSVGFGVVQTIASPMRLDGDERLALRGACLLALLLAKAVFALLTYRSITRGDAGGAEGAVVLPSFAGGVAGTCGSCGGGVTFTVGQGGARCPYCSQTVMAGPGHQAALHAIAAEQADLASAKASRSIQRGFAGAQTGWNVFRFVMGGLRWLLMPVILIIVGASLAGGGNADLEMVGGILIAAGALMIAVVVGAAVLLRRFSRAQKLRRVVTAFARARHGRLLGPTALPIIDWLDRYWAAPVDEGVVTSAASDMGEGIVRWGASFAWDGRPALVVVAHAPHVKRVDLFLSAHRRRGPEVAHVMVSPVVAELRAAGFEPALSNGGISLTHRDSDPDALAPARLDHVLSRAATLLGG